MDFDSSDFPYVRFQYPRNFDLALATSRASRLDIKFYFRFKGRPCFEGGMGYFPSSS